MRKPKIRAKRTSKATMIVVFFVGLPYFSVSVFRWGFQWGTLSKTKWLANARGMEIRGFGILVAMATPTTTWGVSSM